MAGLPIKGRGRPANKAGRTINYAKIGVTLGGGGG